jgi:putative ABC transport system substrate-binding protein
MALALTISVLPLVAAAQKPAKIPRIGYLRSTSAAEAARRGEAFRQGLRTFGYIEGQNITIETRAAEKDDRLADLAAELVRLPVDIIVAGGSPAIRAAKQATGTIPIVMAVGGPDPVAAGLVASLARPGGNVTGVSLGTGEQFAGKWVQLLKEAVPHVSRVAVLWDPPTGGLSVLGPLVRETERAASLLGLQLQLLEARSAREIESAFGAMKSAGAEALIVLPSVRLNTERNRIVELAAWHRLPAIYEHRDFTEVGGLMSYGPNLMALHRRAAYYVDRILKGTKPADLPVEQPTQFELVINGKTAQALDLTLPPILLLRTDQVIK